MALVSGRILTAIQRSPCARIGLLSAVFIYTPADARLLALHWPEEAICIAIREVRS